MVDSFLSSPESVAAASRHDQRKAGKASARRDWSAYAPSLLVECGSTIKCRGTRDDTWGQCQNLPSSAASPAWVEPSKEGGLFPRWLRFLHNQIPDPQSANTLTMPTQVQVNAMESSRLTRLTRGLKRAASLARSGLIECQTERSVWEEGSGSLLGPARHVLSNKTRVCKKRRRPC